MTGTLSRSKWTDTEGKRVQNQQEKGTEAMSGEQTCLQERQPYTHPATKVQVKQQPEMQQVQIYQHGDVVICKASPTVFLSSCP